MSNAKTSSNMILSEQEILERIQNDPSSLLMFELTEEPRSKYSRALALARGENDGL